MVFQLFPHSFLLNSSVDLVIEIQLLYYTPPERKVPDYEEKNPSDSVGLTSKGKQVRFYNIWLTFIVCSCHYTDPLSRMSVIAEKTVSVTNGQKIVEWKEQGLMLPVPKDSVPAGCNYIHVTMFIGQSDSYNQAQDGQHSQYIIHGVMWKRPKPLTLTDHVDTQPS